MSAAAQTLGCSSRSLSSESSAAATERRKTDPQLDDRWRILFVPEETVGVVAAVASAVRFGLVSVASCYFSAVLRRVSKPYPPSFAWTPPRAS